MKERYTIVRIVNILAEDKNDGSIISEPCYQVIDTDYETPESAYKVKQTYRYPQHYIITKYWI